MDDIRLFDTDGDFLVLQAPGGNKYRLLVDEAVRSAVKKEAAEKLDAINITPREIQEEIRNGVSIEQLIARSGASFDFIERFAAPVIAELDYVVSSALSIRLTVAGDRYSDSVQIEFGEIIGSRLIASGATAISWSAKKIETQSWHVTANYTISDESGIETFSSATWSFDPRKLTLSPESDSAVTLSSQETLNHNLIPRLKPLATPDKIQQQQSLRTSPEIALLQETQVIDPVFETPIARFPPTAHQNEAQDNSSQFSTPAAFKRPINAASDPDSESTEEPLSATADLLEALRRKRTERNEIIDRGEDAETNLEPHPNTENLRVIDFAPNPVVPLVIDPEILKPEETKSDELETTVAEQKTPPKKGRASMPSWDEIVFGTKAED